MVCNILILRCFRSHNLYGWRQIIKGLNGVAFTRTEILATIKWIKIAHIYTLCFFLTLASFTIFIHNSIKKIIVHLDIVHIDILSYISLNMIWTKIMIIINKTSLLPSCKSTLFWSKFHRVKIKACANWVCYDM